MRVMLTEAGFKQRIAEAEQHVKILEELRDEIQFVEKCGKGTVYDEVRDLINALDFAIDFIKWGMK